MTHLKRILWPTDFSGNARKALSFVRSLTEKYQAQVHVIYVIEDITDHMGWYGDFDEDHIRKIISWEKEKAQERLAQTCASHLEGCPRYIRHIAVGDPAREILKRIREERIDLVVMARAGAKGHFQFGSVVDKVVKNATVPVITIPVGNMET